jgi:glycerol-3-phosphate dehydrogenase subunit C
LKLVPGTSVNTVERCSGHAGTYGVKKLHHKTAMKIGKPVFRSMAAHLGNGPVNYISSDCQLSGHHIQQGIREGNFGDANPELAHPITLVRKAYGLS